MNRRPKCSDIPDGTIIEACRAFYQRRQPTPDEALAHLWPEKLILAKMDKLFDRGLINYGVSLRTAFVVEDHPEVLERFPRDTEGPNA